MLQGDFGWSFEHERPVSELIGQRVLLTFIVTFSTILFIWVVSFAIGTYVATRQYSVADNVATFLGYLGLATPNFLLALILIYFASQWFDISIGGIMDDQYRNQPWTLAKIGSVLQHLWIPVIVIGTSGTAGMIRRLRANLLDELQKQYVVTGRAKGLHPRKLLWKYPLRVSLNPFIADIGSILPDVISGSAIVAVVLNLDITGRMLLTALQSQDTFLAGSFLMVLALFVVIGTLISDLALAALDPRIRLSGGNTR
jgi:peptide/nickel transport system permease protein